MMNQFKKQFAILTVLIALVLCLPLCGLAAEYVRDRQAVAFNDGDETMVAIYSEVATDFKNYPEFLKDWNKDGDVTVADFNNFITVEWSTTAGSIASQEGFTAEEYEGAVYIGYPVAYLSDLKPEDAGKTVSMKLTNPDGDTFTSIWTLNYSGLVAGTPVVTVSEGDYTFVRTANNRYKLTVQDGAEVSVDTMAYYDQSFAQPRELTANAREIGPTDNDETLISSRYKDTNWPITMDDEFSFIASADKKVSYSWVLMVVHENNLRGSTSIRIDVEVVEKDQSAPTAYYTHEHSFYFTQNNELSVNLLGEEPAMYNGMSEFKKDWDGDGVITADECNKNVKIEWSTAAGKIASTQKFAASDYDNTLVANPMAWISNLKPDDDGKTVTMKLTNSNGDTFTADFTLYYSGWIHDEPVVTTDDADYEFVKTGKNHYKLTVADGAKVSVDFTDYIDASYPNVRDVRRTTYEIDPATGAATRLKQDSFVDNTYTDTNNAAADDDELTFTVSGENTKNYRCNYQLVLNDTMLGNSIIYIDVKVRPGYPTVDIPVYLMTSDNAQQIICSGFMFMTHSSLNSEQKDAWYEIYDQAALGQVDVTYHSENAQLNALLKKPEEPTYLKIRGNGLDAFLNETIIATYSKNGEILGEMYFNIQDETIEMLTWKDPSIAPEATESTEYPFDAVYTINAVEGETVSIKMNYTYSGNIKYLWVVNGEQQQNTADNYRFVATMDHDGMVILNNAGRADFDSSISNTMYEYAVQFIVNVEEAPEVPQGPLTANVDVKMGESENDKVLFIFASDVLKTPGITQEEKNAWNDVLYQNGVTYRWYSEDSYIQSIIDKLGLQPDSNSLLTVGEDGDLSRLLGKTICCAVMLNGEQSALINFRVADTYEMPTWVEPTTLPAYAYNEDEKAEITVAEGTVVTIQMNHKYSKPLIYRWFINEEEIEYSESAYSFTAALTDNGMKVRCVSSSGPIEEVGRSHASSYEFVIKVLPKSDEEVYKLEYDEGITEVPAALEAIPELNTPAKIESTMTIEVMAQASETGLEISNDRTEVYDVKLMYSEDGGVTWIEATEENWPASGKITVTLPYPEGTGQFTHNFVVAHMFTTTTADHKAGDIEYPAVTNTAQGIQFQVTSLSPIAIAWDEKPAAAPAVPATGDSATPVLWLMGMMTACGCMMLLGKRRQHN